MISRIRIRLGLEFKPVAVAALARFNCSLPYRTVAIIALPPVPLVRRPACSPQPLFWCSLPHGGWRRRPGAGGGLDGVARLCGGTWQVGEAFERTTGDLCDERPQMGA